VDLAHAVQTPGVKQDALRRSGFSGINVCHDADVAGPVKRKALVFVVFFLGHGIGLIAYSGTPESGAVGNDDGRLAARKKYF
jgi:hypothetical protein